MRTLTSYQPLELTLTQEQLPCGLFMEELV